MNNNFILASFYMILCSLACIISDTLSKLVSLDTNSLMLIRFLISSIVLLYSHYYVFQYEYWEEEYKKKDSTINSLITMGNIVGSVFNLKILNIIFNFKKLYELNNSKETPTDDALNNEHTIKQMISEFIKNPIFKIWTIWILYITYINLNLINEKLLYNQNLNIITILLVLIAIIIASNTEKTIIRAFIKPIKIRKETMLIVFFLVLSVKNIKQINITKTQLCMFFILFLYIFIRYCIKVQRNIITYKNTIRGLLFGIGMMLFTNGLKQLPLALVILLNFCTPIITVILSAIILKENSRRALPICIINTVGILISLYPNITVVNINAILSIIGASACFSIIDVFNKKHIQDTTTNKTETVKDKIKNKINEVTEGKTLEKLNNIIGVLSDINELGKKNQTTIIEKVYKNFKQSEKETEKKEKITDILLGSSLISSIFFLILIIFDQKNTVFVSILDVFNQKNSIFISFLDLFYSILIGFLAILIPFFMLKASQKANLSSLQPLKYIEFPLSILVGYFLFNESFNFQFFIGFFIIITSTTYSYLQEI